jgi:hypothetical protein
MNYHIVLATDKNGSPLKVKIEFYIPGTKHGSEWIRVLGAGQNGRPNPFHPEDQREQSEQFETARRLALAVFDLAAGVPSPPLLIAIPEWLRRNPGCLGDLRGHKLLWVPADASPMIEVQITETHMHKLARDGQLNSPADQQISYLEVMSEDEEPDAFCVKPERLFVRL